ncbi:MAG: phage portal protein [Bacteroidia bacterium]
MNIFQQDIITTENGVIGFSSAFKKALKNEMSNNEYFIDCSTVSGQLKAYRKCDVVRSVLGKSSSFIANLKVWALDPDTGVQVKTALAKQEISKLNHPNPKEDRKIFFKKLDQQVKLHGRCYVRKVKSGKEEYYYVIPRQFVTIEWESKVDENYERIVKKYWINDGVKSYALLPNQIHVYKDVALEDDGFTMYGASRLESLSDVISTYVILWEVLTGMYGDRGALNIISMGVRDAGMMSLNNLKSEKESLLKRLSERYGIRKGQSKNVLISTDAKVSPLTAKMSDMMFADTIKDCKKSIANAYEIPPELLGIESSRFKTVPEARKEAYTQSAITSFEYYISEWNIMRGNMNLPFDICPDYSHLDFYQEAQLQKAVAFQQMTNAIAAISDKTIEGKPIMTWEQAQIQLDLI